MPFLPLKAPPEGSTYAAATGVLVQVRNAGLAGATRPASGSNSRRKRVDIEPYLRQVAVLEGLNADELVAEAGLLIDKYALLWDQMRADGRLQ